MNISLGADHAGFAYKEKARQFLIEEGHTVLDHGTHTEGSVDYPDFVHPVAEDIESSTSELGLVFCGSGNGVAMTANKHQSIRAAIAWNADLSRLARQHNDANVLSVPARFISWEEAKNIIEEFIKTPFEGGRHERRVNKISCA